MPAKQIPKHIIIGLLITTVFLLTAVTALAQEDPDYDRINEIAAKMNCPTCVGVNLADCRTQTCAQWRDQIGDLVEQGYSDQEVLDFFANRYGTQVLLTPPKSGSTLLLWVLPVIAIIAGGSWLAFYLRSKQAASATNAGLPAVSEDDYLQQVDKDLGLENK